MVVLMLLRKGGNDMEKKFKLIKEDSNYVLIDTENKEFRIQIIDLKIDSKDIFEKLLKNSAEDKSFKFEILTDFTEKEDKRIFDQVKTLFSNIENSLNKIDSDNEDTES